MTHRCCPKSSFYANNGSCGASIENKKYIFSRRTHSRGQSSRLKERKKERAYAPVHSSRLKPEKPKKKKW